jgi:NADP-dependent 3-hydroxy acid dehydrogenase YdfG
MSQATAVITGAAGGLGSYLAAQLSCKGVRLMLIDRERDRLSELRETLTVGSDGSDVLTHAMDVSDYAEFEKALVLTKSVFGRVDTIFNNAGVDFVHSAWTTPLCAWQNMIGANLLGVAAGIRAAVPLMLEAGAGHIVNIASAAGLMSVPGQSAYCATKAAVIALSEGLALEFQELDAPIRVSVACPAFFHTGLLSPMQTYTATPPNPREHTWFDALSNASANAKLPVCEVARLILAGVERGDFYIFPHEGVVKHVLARAQSSAHARTFYNPVSGHEAKS